MKRNTYLHMMSTDEALAGFMAAFDWLALAGTERVETTEALGRITAEAVFAALSSPFYQGSAMDGVALRAERTWGASEERPLRLAVGPEVRFVNTGEPLPTGTDAVVMIEQVHTVDEHTIELRAPAFPYQHVRRVGEDMVAGEMLLPRHHRLNATDIPALLTAGVFEVQVRCRPQVAIIPTGSELVEWRQARDQGLKPGDIMETNSALLSGLVREAGGEPLVWPRQPDQADAIRTAVREAVAGPAHMVILNAGASAGTRDHTVHILGELGRVMTHGVTVMPGKPTILAEVGGKPVIGTPGFPVSAWVAFDSFASPALAAMQGQMPPKRARTQAVPGRALASRLGREELVRVHLGRVGERVAIAPLKRGAGTLTSLVQADGLVRIARDKEGLEAGRPVAAELLRPSAGLDDTLLIAGSHDVTLDLLSDLMRARAPWIRVSSCHLGSQAGLVAIGGGECHLGGTHLLDPATGEYNLPDVRRLLGDLPVRLLTLALREQGLMVLRGNPKGIASLADLLGENVRFVNRQAGSGTRVLLDQRLKALGLSPAGIRGYDLDEYTHTGVAVQVLSGAADTGLGIRAAASALGLDFVPVAVERYELCIPVAFWDDPRVALLRETLASAEFRARVDALGGYDTGPTGQVR